MVWRKVAGTGLETRLEMGLETGLETTLRWSWDDAGHGLRYGAGNGARNGSVIRAPNMATKSNNCCSFKLVEELGFSFHFLSNSN